MSSKQKDSGDNRAGRVAKEKNNPVTEDSLQTKAAGAVQKGGANVQSANQEAGTVGIRGSRQDVQGGSEQGERGGPGTQQAGWSSRQQAQRMAARADEARQGLSQQSGYVGAEQKQRSESQESAIGQSGSQQSAGSPEEQWEDNIATPGSATGSAKSKRQDSGPRK
jgi:hypothetical protein